ncbi:MAG: prepilin-type N-terminal cleavage/methylation domain-containing protein [Chromatiaceae bacterium]|nr:prepilin-type N-terminal cleavage/methylation domain-containing protein [Gammaproteobacteria bacterium]MCP5305423.1 prepilin-type N-terminal cleavage/methylation domain-containing protein [Chromatiaceae bacterium]MCP5315382.1 prepilin-type N-terminal cleavage/methylation domain-containing protein [Chromatiaceae bacterium]
MRLRTWSAGNSRRPTAGFTLLELLAVLMLSGLLLAVVPPLLSRAVPGVQLKSATRTLVSALRQTRNFAISHASAERLTIDLEQRQMRVPGRLQPIAIPEQIDVRLTIAQSQQRAPGVAAIGFFPDGSSTGGRIQLARAGSRYQVDIDWLTGKVAVID